MEENLNDLVYVDLSGLSCPGGEGNGCGHGERTVSYALRVELPQQLETPEAVFRECCYVHNTFASLDSDTPHKNDVSGFFHQRQLVGETCAFVLVDMADGTEHPLDDGTYGELKAFGSLPGLPDLMTYRLEWKKVLRELGSGAYKVIKRVDMAGLSHTTEYLVHNLSPFSHDMANGTVRIDVAMDGFLEKGGIDFRGSGFATSLRLPGFFGGREPKWEEDNIVDRDYVKRQVSMKQTNSYSFQTGMVPDCLTSEVFDLLLMAGDIRMTDYNLNNHSYGYRSFPVSFGENQGTVYGSHTRKARLNLVFVDKRLDGIHRT